jgi:NTP pyrophosphatase (non-canonical NTP hydrolase)
MAREPSACRICPDSMDVNGLEERLRLFAAERDWDQFHTPKNLAMALAGEVGELVEVFQWLTLQESSSPSPGVLQIADEALRPLVFDYQIP